MTKKRLKRIVDAHAHLPEGVTCLQEAFDIFLEEMQKANVEKCALLHLITQPWSFEEIARLVRSNGNIAPIVQVDPRTSQAKEHLRQQVEYNGAKGLKIHPRITPCSLAEPCIIDLVHLAGEMQIPVMIDAFPSGEDVAQGYYPTQYARLAEQCKETTLIYAHMGGHYALDFMMMTKAYKNLYLDCSFSPSYYNMDYMDQLFANVIAHSGKGKMLYGSDTPFISMNTALNKACVLADAQSMNQEELDLFFYTSAKGVFSL